jgi:hypothetical protein
MCGSKREDEEIFEIHRLTLKIVGRNTRDERFAVKKYDEVLDTFFK